MSAQIKRYHCRGGFNSCPPSRCIIFPRQVISLAVLVLTSAIFGGRSLYAQTSAPSDKIERQVLSQMRQSRRATFFVVLRDQADLSQAQRIRNWKSRGEAVVNTLRQHALKTQAPILDVLAKSDVEVKPFWIVNTIKVTTRNE